MVVNVRRVDGVTYPAFCLEKRQTLFAGTNGKACKNLWPLRSCKSETEIGDYGDTKSVIRDAVSHLTASQSGS